MLPDIGLFGPYTYLVTELLWGSAALVLLWRAGAFRRAAKTILVLYPFAYLWDWYTLQVGVFAIPLRTGIDVAGIPLEEHLFILIVPAMVIGVYELLYGPPARASESGAEAAETDSAETTETESVEATENPDVSYSESPDSNSPR